MLTDHSNPIVRGYAFWVLSFDLSADLFSIIKNHFNDDEFVQYTVGCNGNGAKVGDFFINIVNPEMSMNPWGKDIGIHKFSLPQLSEFKQALFTSPNQLRARVPLFLDLKPNEENYSKVKAIVINEQYPPAAVFLAKYKKEQVVPIILKAIQKPFNDRGFLYSVQAIHLFPHPAFFPVLEKALKSKLTAKRDITGGSYELMQAIVSYQDKNAVSLLKTIFQLKESDSERKDYLGRVIKAISDSPHPLYDEMLWKIWKEEQLLITEEFRYLSHNYPEQTLDYIQHFFFNFDNNRLNNAVTRCSSFNL